MNYLNLIKESTQKGMKESMIESRYERVWYERVSTEGGTV